MIVRIIFNQNGRCYTGDNMTNKNVVGRHFIVTMCRNSHRAFIDETYYVPQGVAHEPIIEEADQCVNETDNAAAVVGGGV